MIQIDTRERTNTAEQQAAVNSLANTCVLLRAYCTITGKLIVTGMYLKTKHFFKKTFSKKGVLEDRTDYRCYDYINHKPYSEI